jgi:hypothetical protein
MKIHPIFSSFLAVKHLTGINNEELVKYAYQLKEKSPGVKKSNFAGWQSDTLEDQQPHPEIAKLANLIVDSADEVKSSIFPEPDSSVSFLNNIWININPCGAFNKPHVHPNAVLTGVYYVSTPGPSSKINFQHPGINVQYHYTPDVMKGSNNFTSAFWKYEPVAGDLLVFPAYLSHFVESNMSTQDRISIAFNTSLQLITGKGV